MEIFNYKKAKIEVVDKGNLFSCKVYSDAVPFTTNRFKDECKDAKSAADWVYRAFFED